MSASDSNRGFRQRLLGLIDRSGASDRRLSMLATGSADTVRNMRRGSSPRLDSLEALCYVLGFRLEIAPLDAPARPPEGTPSVEKRPEWSRRLREEIRQDGEKTPGTTGCRPPGKRSTRQIWACFFRQPSSKFQVLRSGSLRLLSQNGDLRNTRSWTAAYGVSRACPTEPGHCGLRASRVGRSLPTVAVA